MANYSRDQDIGKTTTENVTVNDIDTVITRLETNTAEIEKTVDELKKIRVTEGMILGDQLEESVR